MSNFAFYASAPSNILIMSAVLDLTKLFLRSFLSMAFKTKNLAFTKLFITTR